MVLLLTRSLFFVVTMVAIALLIALGAYTCFNRITTSSASGITSPSSSGGGRRKQPGANIRGMKDLPCDPKVG